jgi:hypothetical protein
MANDRAGFQDIWRAGLVLVFAIGQIATTQASDLLGFTETVQSRAEAAEHPLVPIEYAFAIWGLIYLGAIVFAVWQILPGNLSNPVSRRIGWWAAGMYAINTVWQIWAPWAGLDWITFGLLACALGFGIWALNRLQSLGRPLTRREWAVAAAPLGLLTGWLTAATFVNLASSAQWAGLSPFTPQPLMVSIALLSGTLLFAALAVNGTRSSTQVTAIIWALHGIVVANLIREPQPVLAAMAAAGILIVVVGRVLPSLRPVSRRSVPLAD